MTRQTWACAGLLALLAGCTASRPPTSSSVGASTTAATDAAESKRRALVERSIDGAAEAVLRGDVEEFEACEAVALDALGVFTGGPPATTRTPSWVTEGLSELVRLGEELAAASDIDSEAEQAVAAELPPEPGPVAETEVTDARKRTKRERFDLPVVINDQVASLIGYYTGEYRDKLIVAMQRGSLYLPYIREQLRASGLPQDLAFLPLVESAFNTRARSRARAQGMWQFVKGTARLYGLRVDGLVDERNDPYLATRAAVAHLADLNAEFESWELALAAYNSGSGRVRRAIRRAGGSRDFWVLRRYLPRETRNYVPAFWAALIVVKSPTGFGLPPWNETSVCLARIPIRGALDLEVLAERIELTADELAELNPALTHRLTPPRGSYPIAVPCGQEQVIAAAISSIPPDDRVRRYIHTVRRGDTLSVLARRYGSSVGTIMAANGIRNPRRLRIGQKLVIPRTTSSRRTRTRVASNRSDRYVVRRGDTLYDIARRFGTSVRAIKRRNGLGGNLIHPGDVLLMP